jgi:hypothetical protein
MWVASPEEDEAVEVRYRVVETDFVKTVTDSSQ